jgi:hypothetical protein
VNLRRLSPLALLAVALGGCAASKPAPERQRVFLTDASKYTWTGKTVDQVLEVFGRPSSRAPNPEGGTVLTYAEIQTGDTPQPRAGSTITGEVSTDGTPGPSTQAPADRTVATRTQAQFWIDAEGKVTRFWFSPEMYRKGIPSPPSS